MYLNKTILITGANSGLGRNLALNYARQGGRIINLSRSTETMQVLNEKLKSINKTNHLCYSVDVSDYQRIKEVRDDIRKQKLIPDVIINNAAGNFLCPFRKLSVNGWKRIIDIVLHGTFNVTKLFGEEMILNHKQGVILNISTTYASTGSALVVPSAVAKAGIETLTKSLTVEWSKYNIRFVGIAPGPMSETGGVDKLDTFQLFKHRNNYINPRGRMANLNEISKLALFLTSENADYINGSIIRIDGGELNQNSGEFNFITNIPYWEKIF